MHGDFWFGNLLVAGDAVTGVVDWENGGVTGCPLRDLARFPLSYSLYLDRHTRPGHRVLGHRGLRRDGFGAGVRYALLGSGWLPDLVRGFLGRACCGSGCRPSTGTTSRWSASARWPRPRTTRSSGAAT